MRLFISGISGLMGLNAALQFRERFDVSGTYHSHAVRLDGVRAEAFDFNSADRLDGLLRDIKPDIVLHTAGLTNVDLCERDTPLAERLNARAAARVAESARAVGARTIHVSTDHLFSGETPFVNEQSPPAPVNVYASTKLAGERLVSEVDPDALIIRTNFFGWGTPARASFSDWILSSLEAGRPINMFTDVFYTPILVNRLLDEIIGLAEAGATGVFNVAGADRLSKHAFGLMVAERFGLDTSLISATSIDTARLAAPRPRDLSLDSSKTARVLGVPAPSVAAGVDELHQLRETGWRDSLARAIGDGAGLSGSG